MKGIRQDRPRAQKHGRDRRSLAWAPHLGGCKKKAPILVDKGLIVRSRPGPVLAGVRCRCSAGFLAWAEALTVAGQRRICTGLPPFPMAIHREMLQPLRYEIMGYCSKGGRGCQSSMRHGRLSVDTDENGGKWQVASGRSQVNLRQWTCHLRPATCKLSFVFPLFVSSIRVSRFTRSE